MHIGRRDWVVTHAILMIAMAAVSILHGDTEILAVVAIVSMCLFAVLQYHEWVRLRPPGGWANYVTLLRLIVLLAAILCLEPLVSQWLFVGMILFVIIADGLDGYLARKFRQHTEFGAVFDTEVDALLSVLLALELWYVHPEALWLPIAGLLRYLFVLVYRGLNWDLATRPDMPEAKLFAVLFFLSLIIPWILTWSYARWITGAGCVIVLFSFLREFVLMYNVRRTP